MFFFFKEFLQANNIPITGIINRADQPILMKKNGRRRRVGTTAPVKKCKKHKSSSKLDDEEVALSALEEVARPSSSPGR